MSATTTVAALADLARAAARTLTVATGAERTAALNAIADEIEARSAEILVANKIDIDRGIAIYNLNKGIKWRYPLGHFFAFVKGGCCDVARYFFNNGFAQYCIGHIMNYFYYNMDF
jgi:phage gp36-like protein